MRRFMKEERLGDMLENIYHSIYTGGGVMFGIFVLRLLSILGRLVNAGMLTHGTKDKIRKFLTENITISSLKLISVKTNDVVLINEDIHEQDTFKLEEYITWITNALCNDSIMKKLLCGRNTYEGIKAVLNAYGNKKSKVVNADEWNDHYINNNKVYYTKARYRAINIYVKDLENPGDYLNEWDDDPTEELLIENDLLDGKIYAFGGDTLFVETEYGYIIEIGKLGNGRCTYSKMEGHIVGQLEDGSLVYENDGILMYLGKNGDKRIITKNAHLGFIHISDNEVYWKSYFKKQDMESDIGDKNNIDIEQVRECLEEENVSKEILWKGLLLSLYDFAYMAFREKIGNRIQFSLIFDRLPIPFTISEISSRLSEIESFCYEDKIVKTEEYVEVMSEFIALEREEMDEEQTFKALACLLEGMKSNPYTRITNNAGTMLIESRDLILNDTSWLEDEMEEEVYYCCDTSDYINDLCNNTKRNEVRRNIRKRIAEIDALEEAERKKAEEVQKEKKQKDIKNNEKGGGKERPATPDEIGRSAEGSRKPLEE